MKATDEISVLLELLKRRGSELDKKAADVIARLDKEVRTYSEADRATDKLSLTLDKAKEQFDTAYWRARAEERSTLAEDLARRCRGLEGELEKAGRTLRIDDSPAQKRVFELVDQVKALEKKLAAFQVLDKAGRDNPPEPGDEMAGPMGVAYWSGRAKGADLRVTTLEERIKEWQREYRKLEEAVKLTEAQGQDVIRLRDARIEQLAKENSRYRMAMKYEDAGAMMDQISKLELENKNLKDHVTALKVGMKMNEKLWAERDRQRTYGPNDWVSTTTTGTTSAGLMAAPLVTAAQPLSPVSATMREEVKAAEKAAMAELVERLRKRKEATNPPAQKAETLASGRIREIFEKAMVNALDITDKTMRVRILNESPGADDSGPDIRSCGHLETQNCRCADEDTDE